ncbi:OmpA family protein [Vibrio sp. ZSDZ65]|uniref:OmpA family protein n=1 Tax=Vibrio qingdaonensis TaxID=2829491 RepID=A0A9X3CJH5_9VIBR|nr:OmpA family protein [Vibrio qingdaonensis]MCW8344598.1 OmpA family protein [Vibrio qingdaonensis]
MEQQIIIAKKGKKKRDPLQHGGWKVAMADLMISMMCLFLVLWILQVVDVDDQKKLLNYFSYGNDPIQHHGMVESGGNSINPLPLPHVATSHYDAELHRINDTSLLEGEFNSQQELEVLAKRIEQDIAGVDGLGSVSVLVTPQGVKLVIADSDKGPMFFRGGAKVTPFYQDLLLNLAKLLQRIENKMIITGHTDASRYKGSRMTNWELSSNRANSARYYLDRGGLQERHIFQVTGMSDTAPVDINNPKAAINRRIELYILTAETLSQLSDVYKTVFLPDANLPSDVREKQAPLTQKQLSPEVEKRKREAIQQALKNQPVTSFEVMSRYD